MHRAASRPPSEQSLSPAKPVPSRPTPGRSASLALGLFDIGQLESALQTLNDAYGIAKEHGAWSIASNHAWNEVWVRTHAAVPGAREALARLQALDFGAQNRTGGILLARSYVRKGEGDLTGAADDALEATSLFDQLGFGKMGWRARIAAAEALVEMGRVDEARRHLPEISTRAELQDIVYDSRARVRCAEAAGDTESAAEAVRTIVEGGERLAMYRFLMGLAVEVLVAQGDLETADALVGAGRNASVPTGMAFVDQAAARVALARGDAGRARSLAQDAIESLSLVDCALDELRTRVLLARALLATGEGNGAASQLQHVVTRADEFRAALVSREALAAAVELGIALSERGSSAAAEATRPEKIPMTGERLVTVMFADVRGYTAQSAREAPAEMADRIGTLQRWAKQEVERHHGMVDKFAGDAVMATFNVSGAAVDHCLHALEAALAVGDKAALMDLELGIGIAVGPAIVGVLARGRM